MRWLLLACLGGLSCKSPSPVAADLSVSSCHDLIQGGDETDIDCGGPQCPSCPDGRLCTSTRDCASLLCRGGVCASQACGPKGALCGPGEPCGDQGCSCGNAVNDEGPACDRVRTSACSQGECICPPTGRSCAAGQHCTAEGC